MKTRKITIRDPTGKTRVINNSSISEMNSIIRHYRKYEKDLKIYGDNKNLFIILETTNLWR